LFIRMCVGLLLLLNISGCFSGSSQRAPVPRPAPVTKFTMLDGSQIVLTQLRGRTVVVVFWATWCAFSRPVVERLDAMAAKLAHRKDLVFIAVSIDKAKNYETLKDRVKYQLTGGLKHAFSGNAEYDEAYILLKGENLPHVLIIDPRGTIVVSDDNDEVVEEYLKSRGYF